MGMEIYILRRINTNCLKIFTAIFLVAVSFFQELEASDTTKTSSRNIYLLTGLHITDPSNEMFPLPFFPGGIDLLAYSPSIGVGIYYKKYRLGLEFNYSKFDVIYPFQNGLLNLDIHNYYYNLYSYLGRLKFGIGLSNTYNNIFSQYYPNRHTNIVPMFGFKMKWIEANVLFNGIYTFQSNSFFANFNTTYMLTYKHELFGAHTKVSKNQELDLFFNLGLFSNLSFAKLNIDQNRYDKTFLNSHSLGLELRHNQTGISISAERLFHYQGMTDGRRTTHFELQYLYFNKYIRVKTNSLYFGLGFINGTDASMIMDLEDGLFTKNRLFIGGYSLAAGYVIDDRWSLNCKIDYFTFNETYKILNPDLENYIGLGIDRVRLGVSYKFNAYR
ncbi:hypothetical protein DES35_10712 [Schleiferia thermophila]|jgi:hypothetical protein|uniref:Uncharacterized protein n=2 Tax=Schleiferia thermophila TaxID=884107 RepID=A0A368ZWJ5_9FLAO|nr:hypothetical protein CEN47_23615 [Fischerella thermalis CCMEE 5319]RCX01199.1 hypothetical protein DES35_10712 [Schleiferia thermophila]GCD80525.1 hypothetical protein JCM30197_17720 [Schleiferia thermophila]